MHSWLSHFGLFHPGSHSHPSPLRFVLFLSSSPSSQPLSCAPRKPTFRRLLSLYYIFPQVTISQAHGFQWLLFTPKPNSAHATLLSFIPTHAATCQTCSPWVSHRHLRQMFQNGYFLNRTPPLAGASPPTFPISSPNSTERTNPGRLRRHLTSCERPWCCFLNPSERHLFPPHCLRPYWSLLNSLPIYSLILFQHSATHFPQNGPSHSLI